MPHSAIATDILTGWTPDGIAASLGLPDYSSLAKLIYPKPRYRAFLLKKKNGTDRLIASPSPKTKAVQRRLATVLNELDASRPSAHGFIKNRSVASNAGAHAYADERKTYVFNLDLKDFFASITFKRVRGMFRASPFNFPFEKATIFAQLCCHEGALPQGAPTSPALSNYACRRMDGALQRLARDARATYTRYADDMTFSFSCKGEHHLPKSIVSVLGGVAQVGSQLRKVIEDNDFAINNDKVHLRSKYERMEVTGLAINDAPNVRRRFVDEIRGGLQAWKKYGFPHAQAGFEARPYRRSTRSGVYPDLAKHLRGKLLYLRMAKGGSDRVYGRLARRFNACVSNTSGCAAKPLSVLPTVIDSDELEQAVYLLSAHDDGVTETKSTAFFLLGVGIVTCDHSLRDDAGNDFAPLGRFFLQDVYETDLAELSVTWRDKDADVAVLCLKNPTALSHLWLPASPIPAEVGDSIDLVGFPAFTAAKPMTVTPARVLQKYAAWAMQHLDIDALIRKGNSGGPVIDKDLRVVGMAKEGATQAKGNNAVLAVSEIVAMHKKATFTGPPKPP